MDPLVTHSFTVLFYVFAVGTRTKYLLIHILYLPIEYKSMKADTFPFLLMHLLCVEDSATWQMFSSYLLDVRLDECDEMSLFRVLGSVPPDPVCCQFIYFCLPCFSLMWKYLLFNHHPIDWHIWVHIQTQSTFSQAIYVL